MLYSKALCEYYKLDKHKESRLNSHTDIIPPHPSRSMTKIPHPHHCNPNTDTHPKLPFFPQDW